MNLAPVRVEHRMVTGDEAVRLMRRKASRRMRAF
jgi:hypothetical protein